MLFPEQVVDRFDRIERLHGDLDENGIPKGHGTVPQTGKFEGFQIAAPLRFHGDDRRPEIDEPAQIEFPAAVIPNPADKVYGIEMG